MMTTINPFSVCPLQNGLSTLNLFNPFPESADSALFKLLWIQGSRQQFDRFGIR